MTKENKKQRSADITIRGDERYARFLKELLAKVHKNNECIKSFNDLAYACIAFTAAMEFDLESPPVTTGRIRAKLATNTKQIVEEPKP